MVPEPISADLLDAGSRALRRHGYQATTVERIAAEAGLSRVTLHRRGVTKDRILAELATQATEHYRAALWPALTGTGTGAERLAAGLAALCDSAEQHLALLIALRARSDAIFHSSGEQPLTRSVFTDPLERLLRDGVADGSLRSSDPVQQATVLFNLVGWTYVHLRGGHQWPPERARDAVLEIALRGVSRDSQANG